MTQPLFADLGPWELIIIVGILVLLFGAKKLPELARGTGQALRIFKAETKELKGTDGTKSEAQADIDARAAQEQAGPTTPPAQGPVEPEHRTDTTS